MAFECHGQHEVGSIFPGIERDKTMANKLIYLPRVNTQNTPSVDYNKWMKRLDTQPNKPTNQNL